MSDLKKQERIAIEAVARRYSATWEKGSDPPTPISWSLGNGLLLTSQPSNSAALAKITPPSLV
jgi:hypothetical protein